LTTSEKTPTAYFSEAKNSIGLQIMIKTKIYHACSVLCMKFPKTVLIEKYIFFFDKLEEKKHTFFFRLNQICMWQCDRGLVVDILFRVPTAFLVTLGV
jgi:hypothetical protein